MKTVFIADDSNTDRMILEYALKKLGFQVESFSNGQAIFDAINKADKPIIALLDWLMPERSGVDICKQLIVSPPPNLIYTIIVTSRTDKSDIAFALDNGADDFIAKPLDVNELRARINVGIRMLTVREQSIEVNRRLLEYTKKVEQLAEVRALQLVHADRLSTLGTLSAGIAHEINNPTTFVSINIQTLEENLPQLMHLQSDTITEGQKEQARQFLILIPEILSEMKNGVTRIRNIVDGLKTYVHGASEKREWFDVDICIETALKLCANRLKYNVKVTKNLGTTPQIYGDIRQIEQVLVNLFTNAADAIEETAKEGILTITTLSEKGKVIVRIEDSGSGIPEKMIEKIFMPFFTTKAIGKGTGLGLSISSNIVKEHRGEISVMNIPDSGARFTISFPSKQEGS